MPEPGPSRTGDDPRNASDAQALERCRFRNACGRPRSVGRRAGRARPQSEWWQWVGWPFGRPSVALGTYRARRAFWEQGGDGQLSAVGHSYDYMRGRARILDACRVLTPHGTKCESYPRKAQRPRAQGKYLARYPRRLRAPSLTNRSTWSPCPRGRLPSFHQSTTRLCIVDHIFAPASDPQSAPIATQFLRTAARTDHSDQRTLLLQRLLLPDPCQQSRLIVGLVPRPPRTLITDQNCPLLSDTITASNASSAYDPHTSPSSNLGDNQVPMKLRVSAASLPQLRDFVSGADVDLGCEPVAVKQADIYSIIVTADDQEFSRLSTDLPSGVTVEALTVEEVFIPMAHEKAVAEGNRFSDGTVPRGLGEKE